MGFMVGSVQWDVIGGVAVGDSVGCSSTPGEGVTALSEVAAGSRRRECNTGNAGEGDFQVKDDTKVMGSHIPVPSITHPIDGASSLHSLPARPAASGQGTGTGWTAVLAPGSQEPRNLSAYKSLIS